MKPPWGSTFTSIFCPGGGIIPHELLAVTAREQNAFLQSVIYSRGMQEFHRGRAVRGVAGWSRRVPFGPAGTGYRAWANFGGIRVSDAAAGAGGGLLLQRQQHTRPTR